MFFVVYFVEDWCCFLLFVMVVESFEEVGCFGVGCLGCGCVFDCGILCCYI